MRRFILHIGPHKTGTTFIQKLLEHNRSRLPKDLYYFNRNEDILYALRTTLMQIGSAAEAIRHAGLISEMARELTKQSDRPTMLLSHEDILGAIPARPKGQAGLYPYVQPTLSAVVRGLKAGGTQPTVVFYVREMADWKRSLFHQKFGKSTDRSYAPKKFSQRFNLPQNWSEMLGRLRTATAGAELKLISYEEDRASGLHGTALFRICGLTEAQTSRFDLIAPQNVSRPQTMPDA
jgi:hypothetical protein